MQHSLGALIVSMGKNYIIFLYGLENTFAIKHLLYQSRFQITIVGYFWLKRCKNHDYILLDF